MFTFEIRATCCGYLHTGIHILGGTLKIPRVTAPSAEECVRMWLDDRMWRRDEVKRGYMAARLLHVPAHGFSQLKMVCCNLIVKLE
jgi:hypothetical protein